LELLTPFRGEREALAFVVNVNTEFEVTDPINATSFYKFVLTGISGETRTIVAHINLENRGKLRKNDTVRKLYW
jgi:hypothetical protein